MEVSPASQRAPLQTLTASELKEYAVVEAESQLGHARQKHFELDGAHDFTQQDAAISIDLRMHIWGGHQVEGPLSCFRPMAGAGWRCGGSPAD